MHKLRKFGVTTVVHDDPVTGREGKLGRAGHFTLECGHPLQDFNLKEGKIIINNVEIVNVAKDGYVMFVVCGPIEFIDCAKEDENES